MSEAFLVRRGGSGKAYAAISVTYPAGAICTCTRGSKTLRARDTSGSCLFLIPEAGQWELACTNGALSGRAVVTVQDPNSVVAFSLSYNCVLFDNGKVPGYEWAAYAATSFGTTDTKYTKKPALTVGATVNGSLSSDATFKHGMVFCTTPVDASLYRTCHVELKANGTGESSFGLDIANTIQTGHVEDAAWTYSIPFSESYAEYTIDIASISGNVYFGFFLGAGAGNKTASMTIRRVWFD